MTLLEPVTSAAVSCPECGHSEPVVFLRAPDRFHGRQDLYELLRCPSCALVWLKNAPSPPEMGEHYGTDYDRAVSTAGADPNHWTDRRDILAKYKSGGSILDLGCSSGGFLGSLNRSAWTLHGVEMSSKVAKVAEVNTGANVFVGDILDAPFLPHSFDAITCFHVFEHLYHPREVLSKVAEWLKPGGIFFAMMPNIDSAGARIFKSYWYALELPRHLYHFSPASLRYLAQSVGLNEISLTTNREVFIEQSVRYVFDEMFRRAGFPREPMAAAGQRTFPRRLIRKGLRLTILPALVALASLAGNGESIHAIFTKPQGA